LSIFLPFFCFKKNQEEKYPKEKGAKSCECVVSAVFVMVAKESGKLT
jgi:hypothetical protein